MSTETTNSPCICGHDRAAHSDYQPHGCLADAGAAADANPRGCHCEGYTPPLNVDVEEAHLLRLGLALLDEQWRKNAMESARTVDIARIGGAAGMWGHRLRSLGALLARVPA